MKIKKTLAAVLAALCVTSTMPAVISSATYDIRDVNRDGEVDILDVLAINQHLMGAKYYLEYNRLDVNQSHTVDAADANCVLNASIGANYSTCYIRQYGNGFMQPVDMPSLSSTVTLDSSVNETTGRLYKRYSYTLNRYLSDYTLTPTNVSLDATQSNQSRSLINDDDNRTVAHGYENTGIVYLKNIGTGFIVGDHQIATAAHCVSTGTNVRTGIEILTYDRTGTPDGGELTIAEIHVPASYTTPCSIYDYALITVEEDLSDRVHFDIGNCYNMTNSEAGTIPIHVTGNPQYTGDDLDVSNSDDTLYTHHGSVYGSNNRSFLYYAVDTSAGQSGSPAYTITRERYNGNDYFTYTALAVHTTGGGNVYNKGTLMTKHHLMLYGNNPNISY